jgi:Xaa-Pro aminopeptidase
MYEYFFPISQELATRNAEKIQGLMREAKVDCFILQRGDNLRYIASLSPYDSFYLGHQQISILPVEGEPIVLATDRYATSLQKYHWLKDIRAISSRPDHPCPPVLLDVLKELKLDHAKIALDPFMNCIFSRSLERALDQAQFVDGDDILWDARRIKSPEEVEIIEEAVQIAEIGIRAGIETIREGIRECELAGAIIDAVISAGGHGLYAVPAVVSSGERWERCEEFPTEKRIRRGELVNIDEGPLFRGYYGEFARMLMIGEPGETQKQLYQVTYRAHRETIKSIRPGMTAADVAAVSKRIFEAEGYSEFAEYGVGHGLGMSSAEPPWLSPNDTTVLQPGMVLAVEPSVFVPGVGGCRFEDDIVVTEDGYRQLSRTEHPEIDKFFA